MAVKIHMKINAISKYNRVHLAPSPNFKNSNLNECLIKIKYLKLNKQKISFIWKLCCLSGNQQPAGDQLLFSRFDFKNVLLLASSFTKSSEFLYNLITQSQNTC